MKTMISLALGLVLLTCEAESAQQRYYLRYPNRLVSGAQVNLTPLMTWWTNAEAVAYLPRNRRSAIQPKPMAAWARIVGKPREYQAGGWVIDATIHNSPTNSTQAVIFLKHPPQDEKNRFDALVGNAAVLVAQQNSARSAAQLNEEIAHERFQTAKTLRVVAGADTPHSVAYQNRAAQYSQSGSQSYDRGQQFEARANRLSANGSEIAAQLQALSPGDVYQVDLFGLKTGESFKGMPVYDLGFYVVR